MKDLDRIRKVAKMVRKACDKFAKSCHSTKYDFVEENLANMCAVASYTLQKELNKIGIETRLVDGKWREDYSDKFGYSHCWLEWGNYIIDITATQFDIRRKVCINTDSAKHYVSLKEYTGWGWPSSQKPSSRVSQLIMKNA